MPSSFYLPLLVILVIPGLLILITILQKKNSRTKLYIEGVRNENEGHYNLALHNYEDALSEIRRLNVKNHLRRKIDERVKILRTIIEYEKNFYSDSKVNIVNEK